MVHFKGTGSSSSIIKMILLDGMLNLILWVISLLNLQVVSGVSWLSPISDRPVCEGPVRWAGLGVPECL